MGTFISDDHQVSTAEATIGQDGKPLQGWWPDPAKHHEERYFSQGVPTKLYRDRYAEGKTVEGYDDVSAGLKISPGPSFDAQQIEHDVHKSADAPSSDSTDQTVDESLSRRCSGGLGAEVQRCFKPHRIPVDGAAGSIAVDIDIEDDLRGPDGSLEEWVVPALAELAGESAIGIIVGPVVTEHINLSCLAPGLVGPIRATVVPLHIGKHDGIAEVKVVDTGNNGRLMAVGTVTARRC